MTPQERRAVVDCPKQPPHVLKDKTVEDVVQHDYEVAHLSRAAWDVLYPFREERRMITH